MGHHFIGRLRQVRDIIIVMWARRRERGGDFNGALSFLEKRRFQSSVGQDLADVYRLKLMLVTRDPSALHEARRVVRNPSKLKGPEGFYFRAYAKYLYSIMANDGGREGRAIKELEVLDVSEWLRRILPYFKASEIQSA